MFVGSICHDQFELARIVHFGSIHTQGRRVFGVRYITSSGMWRTDVLGLKVAIVVRYGSLEPLGPDIFQGGYIRLMIPTFLAIFVSFLFFEGIWNHQGSSISASCV